MHVLIAGVKSSTPMILLVLSAYDHIKMEQCRRLANHLIVNWLTVISQSITMVDILLHCHQAGRGDLMQHQGKRIILITTLELQPGIINVQINLGRDLTWHLTSSRDQQLYLLCLRWLIFSFSPAISTQHFIQVRKLCTTSSSQ
ncbi:hypothetical protein NC651_040391 [Populus alba x Populus x berolinensis]|nr:hypothetical protein NC651_040391 [Populus alba x Populus x berolinensis]